jgi:ribosomal protein S18 acetylase RimI-like enzyme
VTHILDRPAWNALHTAHAPLAMGGALARRYPPSIVPFAAVADNSPDSLAALAGLPAAGETMALVEAGPIAVPAGLEIVLESELVQMTADRPHQQITDHRVQPLGEDDAGEMLALALLTKPGPFTLGAQKLGTFWGVKIDGKLAAMAGQRMRMTGFTELSGLCTHPEFQGRGLGTLLFRFVAGEIAAREETAFLHAFASNTHAVRLYENLGFSIRTLMNLRIVKRPA